MHARVRGAPPPAAGRNRALSPDKCRLCVDPRQRDTSRGGGSFFSRGGRVCVCRRRGFGAGGSREVDMRVVIELIVTHIGAAERYDASGRIRFFFFILNKASRVMWIDAVIGIWFIFLS